jgi:hypothetical protein
VISAIVIGRSSALSLWQIGPSLALALGKTQDHMPATLSQIIPPRDGGYLAMSIGPCPPAAGHDGPVVHWVLPRPHDPAPHVGATGLDGSKGAVGHDNVLYGASGYNVSAQGSSLPVL